ncbi:hypothetical protein ACF090_02135 [Streptomyces sp. NPDC014892]|uniref:hypothetical protein n=1 Tax=Streptomyces sp. NPDC014892 TaxID=3364930 RepID=UPI003702ECC5
MSSEPRRRARLGPFPVRGARLAGSTLALATFALLVTGAANPAAACRRHGGGHRLAHGRAGG